MTTAADVRTILAELRALGSEEGRIGMARFGINTDRAFGVSMTAMRPLARKYRRDHALALALWDTGHHEARILAALIDDPKQVTRSQMDAWAADFDSLGSLRPGVYARVRRDAVRRRQGRQVGERQTRVRAPRSLCDAPY